MAWKPCTNKESLNKSAAALGGFMQSFSNKTIVF